MTPPERARVCIVVNDLFRGGAQRIILDIASHIDTKKFLVEVAYFNAPPEGVADDSLKREIQATGAEAVFLGGEGSGVKNLLRLLNHIAHTRPVVMQTFLPYASILGRVVGTLTRVPVVSAQCNLPFTYPTKLRLIDALTLPFTSAWTGTTNGIEVAYGNDSQPFSPELWEAGRRHFTIYGGVDVDSIQAEVTKANPDGVRTGLGLPGTMSVVLMVARLISWKGHEDVISAMRYVEDAHLLLVGWGPLEDELKAWAKKEGVEDRVHFLGRRSDVYSLLAAADCYVQAHQQEADGSVWMGPNLSQIEACAAGVPSVSTAVPLIEDLIEDRVSGRLALLNNPQDLARAITETLADREMSKEYAIQAVARVRQRYSVDAMVHAYEGVYEHIIRDHARD